MRNAKSDAEMVGAAEAPPEEQALIAQMIDGMVGRALNEDGEVAEALDCDATPFDPLLAGAVIGAVAVARQWIKTSPESAVRYYARRGDTSENLIRFPTSRR